jgi:hypothetical protein
MGLHCNFFSLRVGLRHKHLKIEHMKNLTSALIIILGTTISTRAQEMGNANYGNNHYQQQQQSMSPISYENGNSFTFSIRGIYNEKAGLYSATFSLVQVGITPEEIDGIVNEKIANIKAQLKAIEPTAEVIPDMISFVPVYEFEASKKIFNKKTYNEKPAGYELKKNIIIKYKGQILDQIISACAKEEVYDFVKVDHVVTNLDAVMQKLQQKTLEAFNSKLKFYSELKGEDLTKKKRTFSESFNVAYPVESYAQYTAFSRQQLPYTKNAVVNETAKNQTQYYNPVMLKTHTYVINPEVTEPAVQLFYDIAVTIDLTKPEPPAVIAPQPKVQERLVEKKLVYMVTQNGEIKQLNF